MSIALARNFEYQDYFHSKNARYMTKILVKYKCKLCIEKKGGNLIEISGRTGQIQRLV